jgi:alkanesulfonate monooxygenase SsuD/methylene tetrahydromethanopterin reductase-like flavin-dependent oxidoreductase (luciferase family)
MELGVFTFADLAPDPLTGETISAEQRLLDILEEIKLADEVGLDVFGVGEHHRQDFAVSSPVIVLAAASSITRRIKLTSAATVLGSDEPLRLFQQFELLDLVSMGRSEIMVGRGNSDEPFKRFDADSEKCGFSFSQKLELLLRHSKHDRIGCDGSRLFDPDVRIYSRSGRQIPIWLAVDGCQLSAARAGSMGLPMALAAQSGVTRDLISLVKNYREAANVAGFKRTDLSLSVNAQGFVGDTEAAATESFFPYYAQVINRNRRSRGIDELTLSEFDELAGKENPLVFGTPDEVVDKILYHHELLGHQRFMMRMSVGAVPHRAVMRSIELMGTRVAPRVRRALKSRETVPRSENVLVDAF